ncbi:endolytic transglycosylase MltG [Orbus wheelerorum]|uniref:endolytic transglycosylase MltG n=1 Tax=Orbus wheelerorum TaxID=3074111 RepID=UPI00370D7D9C
MKKKVIIYFIITCIAVLAAISVGAYYYLQGFSQKSLHVNDSNTIFVLKRGTSIAGFIKQIEQESLVDDAYLIPYLMKLDPSLKGIKSGTYQLSPSMTVKQFLQLLVSGKEVQFQVKFVEGKRAKDWLATLETKDSLEYKLTGLTLAQIAEKLGIEGSIEGWLYPDTYSYTTGDSDLAILKRAHQKMQNALQTVWDNREQGLPYKTPYELLIMASIIEKETGVDTERAKVASVFINRLNFKMLLQTDPTVIYGMGDDYTGRLLTKHLRDKNNRFNTYVISGLPPTPIAMPSLASLEAAAHPEQTNYLYFVADGYGGHIFTTNYNNHKKAVNEYWQLMREKNSTNDAK